MPPPPPPPTGTLTTHRRASHRAGLSQPNRGITLVISSSPPEFTCRACDFFLSLTLSDFLQQQMRLRRQPTSYVSHKCSACDFGACCSVAAATVFELIKILHHQIAVRARHQWWARKHRASDSFCRLCASLTGGALIGVNFFEIWRQSLQVRALRLAAQQRDVC